MAGTQVTAWIERVITSPTGSVWRWRVRKIYSYARNTIRFSDWRWVGKNILKLKQCVFISPIKCEVIYVIGLFPPIGAVTGCKYRRVTALLSNLMSQILPGPNRAPAVNNVKICKVEH